MEKQNPSNQLLVISCEQRAQRLKRAKNLERGERGEEEVEEERSGPGPVRNVIRPRKLQFPRGPGITARRHKIYSTRVRARALVGRGSLFNCLSFARIRTFYRGNCTHVSPRLWCYVHRVPELKQLSSRRASKRKSCEYSVFFFPVQRFDPRGWTNPGVEPRNFEKFSRISSISFHLSELDSWNYFYMINKSNFIIDFIRIIISITQWNIKLDFIFYNFYSLCINKKFCSNSFHECSKFFRSNPFVDHQSFFLNNSLVKKSSIEMSRCKKSKKKKKIREKYIKLSHNVFKIFSRN